MKRKLFFVKCWKNGQNCRKIYWKNGQKGFSINRTLERYVFAGETAYTQCHLVKILSRQPLAEQGI